VIDFSFSEQQAAVTALAEQIFADHGKPDQVAAAEAADEPLNRELWAALAAAGLLGVWLSEEAGGAGGGLLELCAVLGVQGRHVVHAPVAQAAVGAIFADRFMTGAARGRLLAAAASGEAIIAPAVAEHGARLPVAPLATATATGPDDAITVSGHKVSVAGGAVATHFLVPVQLGDGGTGVALVEAGVKGLTVTSARTSDRGHVAHLDLAAAPATLLAGPGSVEWLYQRCVSSSGECSRRPLSRLRATRRSGPSSASRSPTSKPSSSAGRTPTWTRGRSG
jgi:3-oxocholest-4-en-26-oyl-CoA dehydrogenase beta subunit